MSENKIAYLLHGNYNAADSIPQRPLTVPQRTHKEITICTVLLLVKNEVRPCCLLYKTRLLTNSFPFIDDKCHWKSISAAVLCVKQQYETNPNNLLPNHTFF